MKKDVKIFLNHILESIENIETFSKDITKNEFMNNRFNQNAIIRELEIIGEASRNIPDNFRKKHSDIIWKDIIGTRDKLIHNYFGVDIDVVWNAVTQDIPQLNAQIKKIISSE